MSLSSLVADMQSALELDTAPSLSTSELKSPFEQRSRTMSFKSRVMQADKSQARANTATTNAPDSSGSHIYRSRNSGSVSDKPAMSLSRQQDYTGVKAHKIPKASSNVRRSTIHLDFESQEQFLRRIQCHGYSGTASSAAISSPASSQRSATSPASRFDTRATSHVGASVVIEHEPKFARVEEVQDETLHVHDCRLKVLVEHLLITSSSKSECSRIAS